MAFKLCPFRKPVNNTYYVDFTGGDDGNDGLSVGAPWKTITKVNAATFAPSDWVMFKRGEHWRGVTLNPPSAGTAGLPITFGAYGTGAKPIISGGVDLSATGDWEAEGTANVWKTTATHTVNIGRLIFNGDTALSVYKSALTDLTEGSPVQGWHYYDAAADLLYLYSVGNPGTFYDNIEACTYIDLMHYGKAYLTFQNIQWKYGQAMQFSDYSAGGGTPAHDVVEYCDFAFIGLNAIPAGAIGTNKNLDGLIVRYNTFNWVHDSCLGLEIGANGKTQQNIYFYNNVCTNSVMFGVNNLLNSGTMSNIYVAHNISYNGGRVEPLMNSDFALAGMWVHDGQNVTYTNCYFVNNIVMTADTEENWNMRFQSAADATGWVVDYNCYFPDGHFKWNPQWAAHGYVGMSLADWQGYSGLDAHSIAVDPLLVSGTDFHLQAGSDCIDAGVAVAGIGQTYLGAAPDIGAYEKA